METKQRGTLFIVATPIGNLADITLRAMDTLRQVDLIAAEDTRHSKKLLHHHGIHTPMVSLHKHNETKKISIILEQLERGKEIALISDAGTPLISDPGYKLVSQTRTRGIKTIAIPGASALTAALCVSGLPTERFIFEGFLPAKKQQRLHRLQELVAEQRTMVFYEAPHRILDTLENMITIFGANRQAVLAKELTKVFETTYGETLADIILWLTTDRDRQRGEFVILVKGSDHNSDNAIQAQQIMAILSRELPHSQAAHLASKITGVRKNLLYNSP